MKKASKYLRDVQETLERLGMVMDDRIAYLEAQLAKEREAHRQTRNILGNERVEKFMGGFKDVDAAPPFQVGMDTFGGGSDVNPERRKSPRKK